MTAKFARIFRLNRRVSHLVTATALGLTLILTSCSDLKPVADFGKNASAVAGYPEVAKDYPASLQRQRSYGQTGSSVSDEQIAQRMKDAKRLRDAQGVLEAYARALGSLASDDLISYDKEIDALNKSLIDGKFATSTQTDRYAKTAKFALTFVTDIYRRAKIKEIIVTYNPSVQKASAQLVQIVENGYLTGLSAEQVMFSQLVASRARKSTEELEGMPQLISVLAEDREQSFKTKEANAKALAKGIRTFAQGHGDLTKSIGKVDFRQTVAIARKYADQLSDVVKSFKS